MINMSKNSVQFQRGYSVFECIEEYGNEALCEQALFQWRWPTGFECPACGHTHYCQLKTRKLYQCNHCHQQVSLISNTLFANTKLPLVTWFMAIHLLTQSKTSLSAMALKRHLGISYNTAWSVRHKLLQAMKEYEDKKPIQGIIQLDDVYWGGEHRGGKRGRGSENKTPFVAAVALNKEGHPLQMKMNVVEGFKTDAIKAWATQHIMEDSIVISDGLACFKAVSYSGCDHVSIVTAGNLELLDSKAFNWVNTMIGNVKNSLRGSCHAINPKHLPRYLAEFCFRFNCRFQLRDLLPRLVKIAVKTPPMPYRLLKLAESYG